MTKIQFFMRFTSSVFSDKNLAFLQAISLSFPDLRLFIICEKLGQRILEGFYWKCEWRESSCSLICTWNIGLDTSSTFLTFLMSCSTYSKEKKKRENFEKLEIKTIIYCIRHFHCRCTNSNTPNICLQPLQNYSRHYSLTYLMWTLTSPSRTIESTPEIITSSDVI